MLETQSFHTRNGTASERRATFLFLRVRVVLLASHLSGQLVTSQADKACHLCSSILQLPILSDNLHNIKKCIQEIQKISSGNMQAQKVAKGNSRFETCGLDIKSQPPLSMHVALGPVPFSRARHDDEIP